MQPSGQNHDMNIENSNFICLSVGTIMNIYDPEMVKYKQQKHGSKHDIIRKIN